MTTCVQKIFVIGCVCAAQSSFDQDLKSRFGTFVIFHTFPDCHFSISCKNLISCVFTHKTFLLKVLISSGRSIRAVGKYTTFNRMSDWEKTEFFRIIKDGVPKSYERSLNLACLSRKNCDVLNGPLATF